MKVLHLGKGLKWQPNQRYCLNSSIMALILDYIITQLCPVLFYPYFIIMFSFYMNVYTVIAFTYIQSRALNNWAVMTIGLLNREYKSLEQQLEIKQRQYLQMRQSYLEEHLLHHRDVQAKMEYEAMSQVMPRSTHSRPKSGIHAVPKQSLLIRCNSHGDLRTQNDNPLMRNGHGDEYGTQSGFVPKNPRDAFMTQPPPTPQPELAVSKVSNSFHITKFEYYLYILIHWKLF